MSLPNHQICLCRNNHINTYLAGSSWLCAHTRTPVPSAAAETDAVAWIGATAAGLAD